jgi:hypothetical protein
MIVAVRVRPLNSREISKDDMDIISVQEKMLVNDNSVLTSM